MSGQIGQPPQGVRQIGNYRLVQRLGQGSFGNVYLAEHLHLQTRAAVKLLHQQVEEHEREAFLQEARTIATLKHVHILRVLDFGFEQGMPYLVTEYASNGTLRQRHPRGSRVPVPTILRYTRQLTEALQYAHNRELIHRDIKPENILFDEEGKIVLSDFGIALQGSRHLTEKDIAGTATYMAPELFRGKPRRASDQYALGVMVYEWLMGKPPFQGDFYGLVGQHITSPVPPLENVPSDVAKVVHKALEKVPEDRFPTVTAFAEALEQAVQRNQVQQDQRKPVTQQGREKMRKPVVPQQSALPSTVSPAPAPERTPEQKPPVSSPVQVMEKRSERTALPRYGFLYANIIGLIAGYLGFGVIQATSSTPLVAIFGIVICVLAGFVTGKMAVARKMGWITSIVAGLSFNIMASTITRSTPLLWRVTISTLIVTLLTIPFIFCGIWLATRTHPYYHRVRRNKEEHSRSR